MSILNYTYNLHSYFYRYHSMDCTALAGSSSQAINASHFYICTQQTSVSEVRVFATPYYQAKKDAEELHLCKSAEEFLMCPWVLIQLPWNAVLFNQWLLAALAEVLEFKKHLVSFYSQPIHPSLQPIVENLLNPVLTVHRRLLYGFRLISYWPHTTINSKVC
jgi:hypothetical protein